MGKRTAEEVERLLKGYEESGLSRQEYCLREGMPVTILDYYRQRTARRTAASSLVKVKLKAAPMQPPGVPRIVEKGLASDRVVIHTVVAKYGDHLPLYRQAAMLEREAGLEIGRATLDGWVMRVGELLEPVAAAMRQDLLGAS